MAKLIFIDERLKGRTFEFASEKTTVGRSSDNMLCIRDASISRRHCEILVYDREVIVRDLGSRNGTFVNGKRLSRQQAQLNSGQVVRFGSVAATLEIPEPDRSDTNSSSVIDISKFIQDFDKQRKPQLPCQLECGGSGAQVDQTLQLPPPIPSEETAPPFAPENLPRRKAPKWPAIAIGAGTLLLFLFWLFLRSKP